MRSNGFTIIEVLVSIAILGIVVIASTALVSGLQVNGLSRRQLDTSQASAAYLERVSNLWSTPATFGNVSSLPPVPVVTKYTHELQVCTTDITTGADTCGLAVSTNAPLYAGSATTTAAPLVKIIVRYKKVGSQAAYVTALNLGRP